jgi:cytidyltransferase-like protein
MSSSVAIVGAFDDLHSRDVRLLQEAAKLGPLTVWTYSDQAIQAQTASHPKFTLSERLYVLRALRFVSHAIPLDPLAPADALPEGFEAATWVDEQGALNEARKSFCDARGLKYHLIEASQLGGFPEQTIAPSESRRKKVVVTGCFDWFHSGHVRFFEEVSGYGDLYVIVGHDANIRLLKGHGHPLLPQEERQYMVSSVRYVTQALVSSGEGWLDADPEIQKIKPDIYAVNHDGDRGGKREYCAERGIEYLVLNRTPAPGLPQRSSTELRGF